MRGGRARRWQHGFLPTPSARRATVRGGVLVQPIVISTHALREEGDQHRPQQQQQVRGISTHALREEGDARRRWRHL